MKIESTIKWIPIETPPPEAELVLGSNGRRTEMGVWINSMFVLPENNYLCLLITHWAEIPLVPIFVYEDRSK